MRYQLLLPGPRGPEWTNLKRELRLEDGGLVRTMALDSGRLQYARRTGDIGFSERQWKPGMVEEEWMWREHPEDLAQHFEFRRAQPPKTPPRELPEGIIVERE